MLASTSFSCLFLIRVCPAASRWFLRPRCTLHGEIKRGTKKGKGRQKEGVRREERAAEVVQATGVKYGGGGEVRKTCPSLHDPVHYLPRILTITKRYAPSRRSSDVVKSDGGSLNGVARKGRLFRKINTTVFSVISANNCELSIRLLNPFPFSSSGITSYCT